MKFNYYYNNVPGEGLCRNNLIYTSLISDDKKTFVKWYHNDTEYHRGMNQVVNPELMDEKWNRELHFLHNMAHHNPDMVPEILDVNIPDRKIYLRIDGDDFWQRSLDQNCSYNDVIPDWQEQILSIIQAHKDRGWYKHSMHPSSYFIVDGRLKSVNYFFTYSSNEEMISISSVKSHISIERQKQLKKYTDSIGISWDITYPHKTIQQLTFDCFSNNYPNEFIIKAKKIYD
jgi:hypothetical protein